MTRSGKSDRAAIPRILEGSWLLGFWIIGNTWWVSSTAFETPWVPAHLVLSCLASACGVAASSGPPTRYRTASVVILLLGGWPLAWFLDRFVVVAQAGGPALVSPFAAAVFLTFWAALLFHGARLVLRTSVETSASIGRPR